MNLKTEIKPTRNKTLTEKKIKKKKRGGRKKEMWRDFKQPSKQAVRVSERAGNRKIYIFKEIITNAFLKKLMQTVRP